MQKTMLEAARDAGERLLEVKTQVKHGEFKKWIEYYCTFSYATAREYMQVAKKAKVMDLHHFDGGIRAFLDAYRDTKPSTPEQKAANTPDRDDLERALKLAVVIEKGT